MHKLFKTTSSKAGSSVNSSTTSLSTTHSSQNHPQQQLQQQFYYNNNGTGSQHSRREQSYDEYMAGYEDIGTRSKVSNHSTLSLASSSGGGGYTTTSSKHSRSPPPPNQVQYQPSSLNMDHTANPKSKAGIFLVGATYLDTIMHVDTYLPEDSKKRATGLEQRRGGNAANSAEVLGQDPRAKVWFMSSMPAPAASRILLKPLEDNNVKTLACVHHSTHAVPPQSFIILAHDTGSRTIVSHSTLPDLTCDEFIKKFDMACLKQRGDIMDTSVPFRWIHFEGRNIQEVILMIDHVEATYIRQGWRSRLTISVEFEKGDRPGIAKLLSKADVCFFSRLYAETLGFDRPEDFLSSIADYCKPTATLFCTWGSRGAVGLHIESSTKFGSRAGPVKMVVDTIGAGDTFLAGIILALGVRGYDIGRGLRFACHLASRKCGQRGFKNLVASMPPDL